MDKQTSLAFVLIAVIMVVWMMMNQPEPKPVLPNQPDSSIVKSDSLVNQITNQKAVEQKSVQNKQTVAQQFSETDSEKLTTTFGNSDQQNLKEKIITVETDLVRIELSTKGAGIKKYFLKKFDTWYSNEIGKDTLWYQKWVQLINKQKSGSELNLLFVTKAGQKVNTRDLNFTPNKSGYYYRISNDDSLKLTFTFEVENGKYIKKDYTFYGNNYASKFDVELVNLNEIINGYNFDLMWESGINFTEKNSTDESQYAKASVYMAEELADIDATSTDKKETKEFHGKVDWLGIKTKYFGMMLSPLTENSANGAFVSGYKTEDKKLGPREYYYTSLQVPFQNLNYQKNSYELYLGPIDYSTLKEYNRGYEAFYDFGSFFGLKIITRPISEYILMPLFKFLHGFIPNYGFVIIIFSLLIKIPLWPLTKSSYKSMRKMQLLQPKIAAIKEQYKNDPQRVQKETMKMYSTYGINPMGGCLPMILQMPILFALFTFLRVSIDIRHEPFIWWITNLSSPDIMFRLPFSLPLMGSHISGLALFMGITMFFTNKMTMKDPSQKATMYMMPIAMTMAFNGFSSGLNLYYAMFNLFSIFQQKLINNNKEESELVPVKNPKKKKTGFMQRMMEAAEEKQKQQQNYNRKKRK